MTSDDEPFRSFCFLLKIILLSEVFLLLTFLLQLQIMSKILYLSLEMFRREHFILFKFAFELFTKESQGIAAITSKAKCYSDFFVCLFWRIKDGVFSLEILELILCSDTLRILGQVPCINHHYFQHLPYVLMFHNVPATFQSYRQTQSSAI